MRQTSLRFGEETLAKVDEKIANDPRFENRSQYVRAAVRRMLSGEYEQSG